MGRKYLFLSGFCVVKKENDKLTDAATHISWTLSTFRRVATKTISP